MAEFYQQIIDAPWQDWQDITDKFRLFKQEIDFLDFEPTTSVDLIYFDAFAPSVQPELWSPAILLKCFKALRSNGVFVTYSAKGQLRRDLKLVGFEVERLPGPPGKFEMLRATKG
jgi:tRNA U34 5-methylaminomethyl-2-thiouridine-forming methyltransferase MnmC